jgi:arylsulfatase A-like enzyme
MPRTPNILLITSDQQHYDTLGVANPRISTPALDRLSAQGSRFSRAYCPNPTCTPTRASIITGQYPSTHGAWTLGTKLPEDVPTVGDALRDAGYATSLIGKAHFQPLASTPQQTSVECQPVLRDLDFWRNFHGPYYGFDHVELARNHADEFHVGQHYAIWMEEKGLSNWRDYFQSWPHDPSAPTRRHSWDLPEEFHYTTWTAERTIARIEHDVAAGRPFFTWASFHDPHPPYLVPEPWASMYDPADMQPGTLEAGEMSRLPEHFRLTQQPNPDFSAYREEFVTHGFHTHLIDEATARKDMATYYGMISFMDQQIGRIMDTLNRLGVADDTLVVFSTDHGHFLGQHGLWHKGPFHFEDVLRVPMIVRWPGGGVPAGSVNDTLQSLVDLAPTFLRAAGQAVPVRMQGVDQMPAWTSGTRVRDNVIVEFRHQPTHVHLRTYIDDRYKLTVYCDRDYGEMFDLQTDPLERRNLWNDPKMAELRGELFRRWINAELRREPMRQPRIAHA